MKLLVRCVIAQCMEYIVYSVNKYTHSCITQFYHLPNNTTPQVSWLHLDQLQQ